MEYLRQYIRLIIQEVLEEKKKKADRCLRIARRRIPKSSAYRSGNIERCRKGDIWKDLKEEQLYEMVIQILTEKRKKKKSKETLDKWFKRQGPKGKEGGWVDCNAPDGKGGYKACGRKKGEKRAKYPACRPTKKACKDKGKGTKWGKTK